MRHADRRIHRSTTTLATIGVGLLFALGGCADAESGEDSGSETVDNTPDSEQVEATPPQPRPMLPTGATLVFEVTRTISTESASAGDEIPLRLVETVSGSEGGELAAGTSGLAVVTESHESESAEEQAVLAIQVSSVRIQGESRPIRGTIESTETETDARDSGQRSVATVATGAAAGAILGQILGGDTRSTAAGAAVGAAAGLGVALTTRDGHAVLPEGARITVRLDEPLPLS